MHTHAPSLTLTPPTRAHAGCRGLRGGSGGLFWREEGADITDAHVPHHRGLRKTQAGAQAQGAGSLVEESNADPSAWPDSPEGGRGSRITGQRPRGSQEALALQGWGESRSCWGGEEARVWPAGWLGLTGSDLPEKSTFPIPGTLGPRQSHPRPCRRPALGPAPQGLVHPPKKPLGPPPTPSETDLEKGLLQAPEEDLGLPGR